ncbi:putative transcription factor GRAS family [Helianthus annuus]|nr:putative transcription factor GRAS family [Helianthus annuus]
MIMEDYAVLNLNALNYNGTPAVLSDPKLLNAMNLDETLLCRNSVNHIREVPDWSLRRSSPPSSSTMKMLMEENIEEKTSMLHESSALQAAEKSFYDALMVNEPPFSSSQPTVPPYDNKGFSCDVSDYGSSLVPTAFVNHDSPPGFQSSYCSSSVPKAEKKHEVGSSITEESRGKKNLYPKDLDEDGRIFKQSAVYNDPTVRSKMFDDVLLCGGGKNLPQGSFVHSGVSRVQQKGSTGKGRGKKGVKKDVVDLRTLLSLCAQAVAANGPKECSRFTETDKRTRFTDSDGMQRLAHYFSGGLEARMAGSGTEVYKALLSRHTSAVDILKAYHLFLKAAYNRFWYYLRLQWPCFIQRLSKRPGGPPELRITGIDFPCPGFRPSERVEETGSRLANYAETFNVPFKFKAIAQTWETITIDDLELDSDETLVVNCAYRFRYLLDETVMVDSPRNKVMNLIRKIKPDMFIQGVINGSYNAPFFITRFREALFFFSSMFDMIDANATRETPERTLIEKNFWGREAMNVIACEGGERIERPETYKQWQVRNLRAGFRQLPLNRGHLEVG